MIKLKDLENRVYSGKACVGFDYIVKDENEKNKKLFEARFRKVDDENEEHWNLLIVLDHTRDADSQVYNFGYIMPKTGLPLELIAATGLKYFQLYLKEEVQVKINYDFTLGEVLKGM